MKTITSPVKKFQGTVILSDPLLFPQSIAFEESLDAVEREENKSISQSKLLQLLLPGMLACIEKWNIEGFENVTVDNFPSTPLASIAELITWIVGEITKIYQDADEIPNA